nr:MAG TPA: hypothetical protein [Caudoviricetes sp.]
MPAVSVTRRMSAIASRIGVPGMRTPTGRGA